MSTVGRPSELRRFLESVSNQGEEVFITVVEQAPEKISLSVFQPWIESGKGEYIHEPVMRGLSRGRNRGMRHLRGEIVAFPDDDCWYPAGVLSVVSGKFEAGTWGGVSGQLVSPEGEPFMLRWPINACRINSRNIARTTTSATLFFAERTIRQIGEFDEELGAGAGTPFGAAEETDYVLRALKEKVGLVYEPRIAVKHRNSTESEDPDRIQSYSQGLGRVLRKHRHPCRLLYWVTRSIAGCLLALVKQDRATLLRCRKQMVGRLKGYVHRYPRDRRSEPFPTSR
ncbi:glycosyltransferase [Streptomyces sp. TRM66268-LWL]|uniref:Glycosyltransferase n=1 Tax=Streptomyces polyasparticus TaxID=2767826 RepID=A0ABR7SXV0_9ACTN|nr:glycosyltransferase [Streptomyces polyasparticus]MBC9719619.1 glycosyltransferase [Streptomyces polyasparticus]